MSLSKSCKRCYNFIFIINYQVHKQMCAYYYRAPYRSPSTNIKPGINTVSAQPKITFNQRKTQNVSSKPQQINRNQHLIEQAKMRPSVAKEEKIYKPIIYQNHVSTNKLNFENIKTNDIGVKKAKLHQEPNFKHQEAISKQRFHRNQGNYPYNEVKPKAQDLVQKKQQQNLPNQLKKRETQRLKYQQQISALQKNKKKIEEQIVKLEGKKKDINYDINELVKLKQIQTDKYKRQMSRYQNDLKGTQRMVQAKNYANKRNQEIQGINKNNLHIKKLQKEVQGLRTELQKANMQKQTLSKRKNQYGLKISRSIRENQQEELRNSNVHLQQKINDGNKQINWLRQKNTQQESRLKQLQEELKNITNSPNKTANEWKNKYEKVQQQLLKIKDQNQHSRFGMSTNHYYKKIQETNNLLKKQQQEKNNLKVQVEKYRKQSEKHSPSTSLLSQYTKEIEDLKNQLEKLRNQNLRMIEAQKVNSVNLKVNQYIAKIKNLQQEVDKQRKDSKKIQSLLDQKTKALNRQKQHDQFKQQTINRLEKQNQDLRREIKESKQKIESPSKQFNQVQKRNSNLQQELKSIKDQYRKLQNENNSIVQKDYVVFNENKSLKRQIQQLKSKNNHLQNQNAQSNKRLNQSVEKYKLKDGQFKFLRTETEKINIQKNKEIQSLKNELDAKQQKIQKYQKQIQLDQKQINDLSLKLGIYESEKQSAKNLKLQQDQKLIKENYKLKSQIWTLQDNIKVKEEKINKTKQQLSKSIQQKQKQINQFNLEIINKQKIIRELQKNVEKYGQQRNHNYKLEQEKKKIEQRSTEQIKNLTIEYKKQIDLLKDKIKNNQSTIESLKKQIKAKQLQKIRPSTEVSTINDRKYKILQEDNKKLHKKIQSLQNFITQLENSQKSLQQNSKQLIEQNKKITQQNNKIINQNSELQKQISTLKQNPQSQINYRSKYMKTQQKSKLANSRISQQNQKLEEIKKLQKQISTLEQKCNKYEDKCKDLQARYQQEKRLFDQLSKKHQICLGKKEIYLSPRTPKQNNQELVKLRIQVKSMQKIIKQIQSNLEIQKQRYKMLEQKFLKKTQQLAKKNRQGNLVPNSDLQCMHLFHGQVLRGFDQYKVFIKKCIQDHVNIRILDTRLIYRFDPLSKQNIHKYIDEKPHLVVLVRMINGYCLAGYAQGIFKPRSPQEKQGLIMSLTNQKCYYLVERNKRSIAYDDFFVIFGNSEIRIKSLEKKIFSNFGLSSSYYRHNGDGVTALLGGGRSQRQMEIIGYQFHQLILKQ